MLRYFLACATLYLLINDHIGPAKSAKPHIKIVTPGVVGFVTLSSISLVGPAIESGLKGHRQYDEHFTVSHKYLYMTPGTECAELSDNIQDLLARWYYHEVAEDEESVIIIVTSGCTEGTMLSQMAANWNILLITTWVHYSCND